MMTEIDYLIEISDKLDILIDKIEMVIFIAIFAVFIHYSEKWLKIALDANNKAGRVK